MKNPKPVTIGVIGCGQWGPNHIRVLSQLPHSRVVVCADLSRERLHSVKVLFPHLQTTTNYQDILHSKAIDAVCIASPTNTHFSLAKESLHCGKHVLCEKPLALSVKEAQMLKALAREKKKILMVGHIFVFNPGIIKLKEYIQFKELGRIYYAHSERTNLGPFRYDVNSLWDLGPHEVSIFNYLFDAIPLSVSARGQKCLGTSHEDLSFATLEYPKDILVNMHVSWLDPKKVRQITIVGDKKMVVWDDLDNVGPVKLYNKHVEKTSVFYENYGEFQLLSKEGSITIPNIGFNEPLKIQDQYFIQCILKHSQPKVADAQKALDVIKTLEAIQKSMDKRGTPVEIA